MSLAPDQTILSGKYRIVRLAGEGGMARVWLAEELTFGGRQVAIKEPKAGAEAEDAADVQRRFQQEISLTAALMQARASNIVPAWTVEPFDGGRLLVMQYMPGGSLEELLRQPEHAAGLPIGQAVAVAMDVLAALEALHRLPAEPVHRDVKPSNILFDGTGRACLADFGLAQLPGASGRSRLAAGAHPATPLNAAPEQLRSPEPLLPAADLFALGCVLWEMLTGQRYKRHKPGTPPSGLRAGVPAWLDQVVMRALAEDAWERWPSAGEMAQALAAGAAAAANARAKRSDPSQTPRQTGSAAPVRTAAAPPPAAPARRRPAGLGWLAGAVALLAMVAVIAWVMSNDSPQPKDAATAVPGLAVLGRTASPPAPTAAATLPIPTPVPPTVAPAPATDTPAPPTDTPIPPTDAPEPATPTPTLGVGSTMVSEIDGMEYVYVPAGEFLMGSTDADPLALDNEKPQHTVYLDGYWIARTEATAAQYRRCVEAGACPIPGAWDSCTHGVAGQEDHPVNCVSWGDAAAYCRWAGCRLPTEAEWEKAARGTDGRIYPWGDRTPDAASTKLDWNFGNTSEVGSYPAGASPYGALDMAGNVWEWVADWYDGGYYVRSSGDSPQGPASGGLRVLRGGSWDYNAQNVRVAVRSGYAPDNYNGNIGFRPARSP